MRPKLVAGNWKMHTTAAAASQFASAVVHALGPTGQVKVAVCPPYPYHAVVGKALLGSPVALGAQNLCPETEGAFTGEVSPAMLVDLDCRYVILGHSERRHKPELDESDAFISRKVRAAPAAGLPVILCVGETLEEREAGRMERVLEAQLAGSLANLDPSHMAQVVLAYEPVWAIGTGPYGEFIRPTWKWPAGLGLRTSARCLFRPMDESFPTPDTSDFPGRASGEL